MHKYALARRNARCAARHPRGHRTRTRPIHVTRKGVVLHSDGKVDTREWPDLPVEVHLTRTGSIVLKRSDGPAFRLDSPTDEEDLVRADSPRAPVLRIGELAPAAEVFFDVLFDEDLGADLCRDAGRF